MKNDIDGIDVYGGTVDSGALLLLWALGSKERLNWPECEAILRS